MIALTRTRLEPLREALRARGQRPSVMIAGPHTSHELIEALRIVEEWGPFVELMYIVMAVDRRVMNVEREVLRGALAVLSDETVRTRHMEAMLDAAARKMGGVDEAERRLPHVLDALRENRPKAEAAAVVAAAVAAADDRVVPEEHALIGRILRELDIDDARAGDIVAELETVVTKRAGNPA